MKHNALYICGLLTACSLLITACGSSDNDTSTTTGTPSGQLGQTENIALVPSQSDAELERYLKQGIRTGGLEDSTTVDPITGAPVIDTDGDASDAATQEVNLMTGGASQSDPLFSQTNVQIQGVDEADSVKFDGKYLYVSANNTFFYHLGITELTIASTIMVDSATDGFAPPPEKQASAEIRILETSDAPAKATEIATITMDSNDTYITGMYLYENDINKDLALITNKGGYSWSYWNTYAAWDNQHTQLTLYNVNNPASPTKDWSIDIEGALIDSRRIKDKLYLVTRFVPEVTTQEWNTPNSSESNSGIIEDLTLDEMLPKFSINQANKANLVSSENCYVPDSSQSNDPYYSPTLITITAISLDDPESRQSVCIGGHSSGIFSSAEALYIFNDSYYEGTIIHKFAYSNAGPSYRGSGHVVGSLGWNNPTFRLGEKNGALFAVSTTYEEVTTQNDDTIDILNRQPIHRLTVLKESENNGTDSNLKLDQIAILPNEQNPTSIGKPGENIYSVRYMGDRGYIVTFQKIDPLYVIDLSTPEDPKIAGELIIEGYSDYLHPVGDNHLLGIGKDAIDDGSTTWYQGVKVGLFDVSDISNPQTVKTETIGMRGSETMVSYDHKAFTFLDYGEGVYRMALPVQVHDGVQSEPSQWLDWQYTGLHLFDINTVNGGQATMESAGILVSEQKDEGKNYASYPDKQRGVIKGESVHYVYGNEVWSADWGNAEESTIGPQ